MITTITDYARSPRKDARLFSYLRELYDEIAIWPQGRDDEEYIRSLGIEAQVLADDLDTFDLEVAESETDYVGTRLHAGIRALQHGTRSTIIEVDNRAREMGADLGLPVVSRDLNERDRSFIADDRQVSLSLPHAEITLWKSELRHWAETGRDGSE